MIRSSQQVSQYAAQKESKKQRQFIELTHQLQRQPGKELGFNKHMQLQV